MLTDRERTFLAVARRAVLATIAPDGRPRPVPICFVLSADGAALYTPLDDKPKRTDDPRALARVRDIGADSRVSVLVDRWDEDWTRLAWLRIEGRASLILPADRASADAHRWAVDALRARYPQYAGHRLETRPVIRIAIGRAVWWGATGR